MRRQNITHKFTVVFILALTITLLGCRAEKQEKERSYNLQPRFSFGSEGEVAIAAAWQLATDEVNSIFVPDYMANCVYQFNFQGEFQQSYGREGRGPGEFTNPTFVATDGKWLYVEDMRLVMFDLNSDSTKIATKNKGFSEFEVHENRIFAFAPAHFLQPVANHDENLISIYNSEGNMIDSFGEYLNMEEDLPAGMSWPNIEIEDSVVHLAFQYFPYYRAYSTDGELLLEMDLSQLVSVIPNPEKNYSAKSQHGDRRDITAVFRAMDTHEHRIFIARQAPSFIIDEYLFTKDSLIHRKTYSYDDPQTEINYLQDFFYHEASKSFYILEVGNKPTVGVYAIEDEK